jgi:hypothetical protein
LNHIPGGNIAMAYFRHQLPPELEFDTDRPFASAIQEISIYWMTASAVGLAAPRPSTMDSISGARNDCFRSGMELSTVFPNR